MSSDPSTMKTKDTPIEWQQMCEKEYGVKTSFMDSWKETYLIMLKYGMINMNHIWMGKTLNYWCEQEQLAQGQLGTRLADACFPDGHPIGEFELHYVDMLKSRLGDQYFVKEGFSYRDIIQIKKVVHREIFILYHAMSFPAVDETTGTYEKWQETDYLFAIGKVYAHHKICPKRNRRITELTDLYLSRKHPLIAVLLFSQFTLEELVCIGV